MELNKRQLEILQEAGISVPSGASDDSFLTAEDEERLGDYLIIECLDDNQNMTPKAREVQGLLNYLAG